MKKKFLAWFNFPQWRNDFASMQQPLIGKILQRAMCIFLFFFPTLLVLQDLIKLFIMDQTRGYPFHMGIVFCIFIAALIFTFSLLSLALQKSQVKWATSAFLFLLVIAALFVRVVFCVYFEPTPMNDFARSYGAAVNPQEYSGLITRVPYYATYSLTIRLFMKLAGSTAVIVPMLLQSVMGSLIPLFLYFIVYKTIHSSLAAGMAAAFYAFFPPMIYLCACVTNENFAAFWCAVGVLGLVYAWDAEKSRNWKHFFLFGFLGVFSFVILVEFKPLGIVFVVLFFAFELLFRLIPAAVHAIKTKNLRHFLITVCFSLLFVFSFQLLNNVVFSVVKHGISDYIGEPVQDVYYGADSFAEIAYFGLLLEGNGQWNQEVLNKREALKAEYPIDQAHEIMMNTIVQQFKDYPEESLELLRKKISISWSDSWEYRYYATYQEDASVADLSPNTYTILHNISNNYMLVMYLGILAYFVQKIFSHRFSLSYMEGFILLFWGALFCIFLILEANNRYRSVFMPILCIFPALGYTQLATTVSTLYNGKIKNRKAKGEQL